jgi:hypothetical protein
MLNWGIDENPIDGMYDTIKFNFKNFYEDEQGDQLNRNYLQDGDEPTIQSCQDIALGPWQVYVRWVSFYDGNNSGVYDAGDTILGTQTSDGLMFTLTNDPYVRTVNPSVVEPLGTVKIKGGNFGAAQGSSYVKVGDYIYGPGHTKIKNWTATIIKLKVKAVNCNKFDPTTAGVFYLDKQVSVYVEVTPSVFSQSNKFPIKIIKPLSCGGVPYPGP